MIEFKNVTVIENSQTILDNINLVINTNEMVALTGHSGSGKSSILLTLLGIYQPVVGEIFFNKELIKAKNISEVRKKIAYVSQEPILGAENVYDSLMLPFNFKAYIQQKPTKTELINTLNSLNLDENILSKSSTVVSGGEKQRLVICRSLLLGKKVFLLDEITSALDPESKEAVINLFANSGYTILAVSHDSEWINRCHTKIEISKGKIAKSPSITKG